MKTIQLFFLFFLCVSSLNSQNSTDSLVYFEDLKFHSDFERVSFINYFKESKDTFNLFLAIDEKIDASKAKQYYKVYNRIFEKYSEKHLEKKNLTKKIKTIYSETHSYFLRKYNDLEYFPMIFQDGTYNCVSASMLYALIFETMQITYKIQASSNHVYIVANPGENSIVIETTNPMFENAIFNGEFKKQYVSYLRDQKLISEEEYKNKSTEEIFEQKFNEVKDSEFQNLPGFQYYNKTIEKLNQNQIDEAFELCKKAYFFYSDNQVRALFYNILIAKLTSCRYKYVEDIDLLVYLSRFKSVDPEIFSGLIFEILADKLQYSGNEEFCDSLYDRFESKIRNDEILTEVGFTFNLKMYQQVNDANKSEKYLINALKLKDNHKYAIQQFRYIIYRKFERFDNSESLLDSLEAYVDKYNYEFVKDAVNEIKLLAYLRIAKENFEKSKMKEGDTYLLKFENNCDYPVENIMIQSEIVTTYRTAALKYYYWKNKVKMREYLNRGLKYVPESDLLKSML